MKKHRLTSHLSGGVAFNVALALLLLAGFGSNNNDLTNPPFFNTTAATTAGGAITTGATTSNTTAGTTAGATASGSTTSGTTGGATTGAFCLNGFSVTTVSLPAGSAPSTIVQQPFPTNGLNQDPFSASIRQTGGTFTTMIDGFLPSELRLGVVGQSPVIDLTITNDPGTAGPHTGPTFALIQHYQVITTVPAELPAGTYSLGLAAITINSDGTLQTPSVVPITLTIRPTSAAGRRR